MLTLRPKTNNYYMFRVDENSPIIGQFALDDVIVDHGKNHALKIVAFGIHPAKYRGNGYGQQMLKEAIEEANRIRGNRKLILNVKSDNVTALHIYEKNGFKITDEWPSGEVLEMTYFGNIQEGCEEHEMCST